MKKCLCPVWTMCGRNKAARDLLEANIWVGHVLSMDTEVPPHAIRERIRYFELIARTFDVVVFDEADMVQSVLDDYGAATLRLSGAEDSIHLVIQEQIHNRFARGENYRLFDRAVELYSRDLAEFGNHNTTLITAVQNMPSSRVSKRYENQLLTVLRIVSDLLDGFEKTSKYEHLDEKELKQFFNKSRGLKDFRAAKTTRKNARNVELSYISFVGATRMLMHRFHRLFEADGELRRPAILMTSATSFLEASPAYHINIVPHYLLKSRQAEHDPKKSIYRFKWIPDCENADEPLRYSGAGELRERNLEKMVDALVRRGTNSEIYKAIHNFDVQHGIYRKAALIVNSYEQARAIKKYLNNCHPEIGKRTKAVVRSLKNGEQPVDFVTTAQCEALGDDETCDILIFPMLAIGRGVNIVFTKGSRRLDAAIGTIYFLTRPHPTTDDMQLLCSLAGQATQEFDNLVFTEAEDIPTIANTWQESRKKLWKIATSKYLEGFNYDELNSMLYKYFDIKIENIAENSKALQFRKPKVLNQINELKSLVKKNKETMERLHPNERPLLIIFYEDELQVEVKLLKAIISVLWGETIEVMKPCRLPEKTHGPKELLPGSNLKAKERSRKRIEAWEPIVKQLSSLNRKIFCLVMAREFYPDPNTEDKYKHDDVVNKPSTRQALAKMADCRVQFILPIERTQRENLLRLDNFFHRAQAALKDLLLAHSGYIEDVKEKVDQWLKNIPIEKRPKEIIGITIVRKQKGRVRGPIESTFLLVAMRLTVETGECELCCGYEKGNSLQVSPWSKFSDAIAFISRISPVKLASNRNGREIRFMRQNFNRQCPPYDNTGEKSGPVASVLAKLNLAENFIRVIYPKYHHLETHYLAVPHLLSIY